MSSFFPRITRKAKPIQVRTAADASLFLFPFLLSFSFPCPGVEAQAMLVELIRA